MIPRGITWRGPALLFAGILLIAPIALRTCSSNPRPLAPAQVDTAAGDAFAAELAEAREQIETVRGERDGLRGRVATLQARVRGLEERTAEHITVYDTMIDVRTVPVGLQSSIDRRGQLTVLVAVPTAGGHQPEQRERIDVADCDDGLTIVGADVICDRARLGHMSVYVSAGASAPFSSLQERAQLRPHADIGVHWQPSFRSTWSVRLAAGTDGRVEVDVRRGIRIW